MRSTRLGSTIGRLEHSKQYHVDGRNPVESTVVIRRSEKVLPLTVLPELSFFSVVHQELKWSGSTI
jgi:hypothetical protein